MDQRVIVCGAGLMGHGIAQVLALLSWNPARIAGLESTHGGPLAAGRPANLCVIDPAATWLVDPDALVSRSRNTPYAGRKLTGRVRHTLLRGEPVVAPGARSDAGGCPTAPPVGAVRALRSPSG